MGRTKYTPEARNAVMAAFVEATKRIIDEEGVEAASIRRVSTAAGYSSAALYLYFEDMNELVTMSLITYLSDYVYDIIESTPADEAPEEAYKRTWELFCMHAFAHPYAFINLFFGPQSSNVNSIAQKYYELFPDELENANKQVLDMLSRGNLADRNQVVLEIFAKSLGFSEHETELANDLTVSYFHYLLLEISGKELEGAELSDHVNRFMEGALFILRS